jgi:hypothetical protein
MKHIAAFVLVALAACRGEPTPEPAAAAGPAPGLQRWILPTAPGAAQPDLVLAPDGRLLLSWLDSQPGRRTRLQFSDHGAGSWGATRTIAIGSSFFVNWADTPHLMATPDGMLWVQWLQKSGEGAYAYDVVLSNSRNDGMNWSAPIRPHEDGTVSEHGFAALWAQGNDRLGIAWLDGRNTVVNAAGDADEATGTADEHDGHGRGAMTLRAAFFDGAQRKATDSELDDSVCDCCQTDVAMTGRGPLLVYRDRTADEIRDIHAMRYDGRAWSASKPVFADDWKMPACPVNGPAVAAQGDAAVVAWYTVTATAAGDVPTVRLARSDDAGGSFAAPVDVDSGMQVQGRVDVAVAADAAWVLWLREDAAGQSLMLARYAPDLSRRIEQLEVAKLQGRGRGTGFPQLVLRNGVGYIVWTEIIDGQPRLQGATYRPDAGPTSPSAS